MTTTINASTSSGLVVTPDNSGNVLLQYNGQSAPAFSAYKSSNQTVSANTYVKLTYDTELFDTNNNFSSSRFTPTVAGYYQINASINIAAIGDSLCNLYKNGTVYQWGCYTGAGQGLSVGVSSLVYLNGTSDYVEIYIYTGGTTVYGDAVGKFTWFNGCLLRGS